MLRYKNNMDVLWELKVRGYTTTRLRKEKIIGEGSIDMLRNNEVVSTRILDRLCKLLDMQPGDILEYVPDTDTGEQETDMPLFAAAPLPSTDETVEEEGSNSAEE